MDSKSGYHLGHLIRDCMLKDPDAVCQIDAATGEEETRQSVLTRSITLAKCLRALGLQPGDVLALGGDNHLDLHIPYYAALMNGYPIAGVDPFFKFDEVKHLFEQVRPKLAFCQKSSYQDYRRAVEELGFDTRIVTFDGDDNTMAKLIEECDVAEDEFQIADFDTDRIYAWLVCTSGSTGLPKVAAIKHEPILKIDAATGEEETRQSVLTRSITLAKCLRALGLQPGDVLALGGDNHLDLHIPYYAALMNGYPIAGVDPFFKFDEVKHLFEQVRPKLAFCQKSSYQDYRRAVEELGFDTRIVTFDGDDNTMAKLIEECDVAEDEFQIADFDTDRIYAWLVCTSGSTGLPKVAAIKHEPILKVVGIFSMNATKTLTASLNLSAVQWVSAFFNAICYPNMNQIKVQTSAPATPEHVIDIINKYRPVSTMSTPSILYRILHHEKPCDLTCFKHIFVAGACVQKSLLLDLRAALGPNANVLEAYGQTESLGPLLRPMPDGPLGNCGVKTPLAETKLVDPVTGKTVTEPNVPGELWTKGTIRFTEYYNNPAATAEVLTPDGWYKTGDLLKRDENGYYFFVERLKMLIKFRSYHVVPMELEEVILTHDGVQDVCVTSIANQEDGEWPVAVVTRKPAAKVTAQDIKDLIANKLSEHKKLRGGVLFIDEMPMTSTGKIARAKVRQLVETSELE